MVIKKSFRKMTKFLEIVTLTLSIVTSGRTVARCAHVRILHVITFDNALFLMQEIAQSVGDIGAVSRAEGWRLLEVADAFRYFHFLPVLAVVNLK